MENFIFCAVLATKAKTIDITLFRLFIFTVDCKPRGGFRVSQVSRDD